MKIQQLSPIGYAKLMHRVQLFRSYFRLGVTQEQNDAYRLLEKLEEKIDTYKDTHEIPKLIAGTEYSKTCSCAFRDKSGIEQEDQSQKLCPSNFLTKRHFYFGDSDSYTKDFRSDGEMVRDLGILYAIFGSTYQTTLNYHVYQIRFKKQIEKWCALCRVQADVYEDGTRICEDMNIGFWPLTDGDDRCEEMEFTRKEYDFIGKYNNGCNSIYARLFDELMEIWNYFFNVKHAKTTKKDLDTGYVEEDYGNSNNSKTVAQLNKEQRNEVISKVDGEIWLGLLKNLEYKASKVEVIAYQPYSNLKTFLEESGVVYQVEVPGIYVWNSVRETFERLVGYRYDGAGRRYYLYLL